MHVISRKALRLFWERHPESEPALARWCKIVERTDFGSFGESISPLLSIRDEHEYDLAVERLNELLDEIGTDEGHPLYGLLETLGTLIYAYEEEHYPLPECRGAGALPLLMEEHGLTEAGLPEVGPREVVSEVLSGKRELDVGQIRALAQRFHVSPAVFI